MLYIILKLSGWNREMPPWLFMIVRYLMQKMRVIEMRTLRWMNKYIRRDKFYNIAFEKKWELHLLK